MDGITYVMNTLVEVGHEVHDKIDYNKLMQECLYSEVTVCSVVFILAKFLLGPMKNDKALKPFLVVYNAAMALFSLACFVAMSLALQDIQLFSENCESGFDHKIFNIVAKAFYLSKFVEYIDSWSLILRGKKVTYLQFIHHLGAPWDMFLFYHFKNEAIWIFVFLNSFVHTVMYSYYLATLLKIRVPFKSLITMMQIAQFNTGFYIVWAYKDVACYRSDPYKMFGWLFNYVYVGTVEVLFLNFFLWTYIRTSPKKKKTE